MSNVKRPNFLVRLARSTAGFVLSLVLDAVAPIAAILVAIFYPAAFAYEFLGMDIKHALILFAAMAMAFGLMVASDRHESRRGMRVGAVVDGLMMVATLIIWFLAIFGIIFGVQQLTPLAPLGLWFVAFPIFYGIEVFLGNVITVRVARRDFGGSVTGGNYAD